MGKITVNENITEALHEIAKKPLGKLYTVTCFSDKGKFLPEVEIMPVEEDI